MSMSSAPRTSPGIIAGVATFLLFVAPAAAQDQAATFEDHLKHGAAAYDDGDFEQALIHYGRARNVRDVPALRVQMAQLHERLGQCSAALVLYESVVTAEDAAEDLRKKAERGVEGFEGCRAEAHAQTSETEGSETKVVASIPDPSEPEVVAEPEMDTASTGRLDPTFKTFGWTLVITGAVGSTTGLILGNAFYPAEVRDCIDGSESCTDEAARSRWRDFAVRRNAIANAALFGGIAVATVGVGLLAFGPRESVTVAAGAGTVSVRVTF